MLFLSAGFPCDAVQVRKIDDELCHFVLCLYAVVLPIGGGGFFSSSSFLVGQRGLPRDTCRTAAGRMALVAREFFIFFKNALMSHDVM